MRNEIDTRLAELIDSCQEPSLREAMSYSVSAGGKRMRPLLLLGACEAASGEYTKEALDFACALELIHNYSLIHDDLPAMDNDDFRRGKPTTHKQFGEAMAILSGDALLNRAYETMIQACINNPEFLPAMKVISAAAGDNGMIAGQVIDIRFQNKQPDKETMHNIYKLKTGALFAAAFEAGAILGKAAPSYVRDMKAIGEKLGRAFQIQDDIIEETDYAAIFGMEEAKAEYNQISSEALNLLGKLPQKTQTLAVIVQEVINRSY